MVTSLKPLSNCTEIAWCHESKQVVQHCESVGAAFCPSAFAKLMLGNCSICTELLNFASGIKLQSRKHSLTTRRCSCCPLFTLQCSSACKRWNNAFGVIMFERQKRDCYTPVSVRPATAGNVKTLSQSGSTRIKKNPAPRANFSIKAGICFRFIDFSPLLVKPCSGY